MSSRQAKLLLENTDVSRLLSGGNKRYPPAGDDEDYGPVLQDSFVQLEGRARDEPKILETNSSFEAEDEDYQSVKIFIPTPVLAEMEHGERDKFEIEVNLFQLAGIHKEKFDIEEGDVIQIVVDN